MDFYKRLTNCKILKDIQNMRKARFVVSSATRSPKKKQTIGTEEDISRLYEDEQNVRGICTRRCLDMAKLGWSSRCPASPRWNRKNRVPLASETIPQDGHPTKIVVVNYFQHEIQLWKNMEFYPGRFYSGSTRHHRREIRCWLQRNENSVSPCHKWFTGITYATLIPFRIQSIPERHPTKIHSTAVLTCAYSSAPYARVTVLKYECWFIL